MNVHVPLRVARVNPPTYTAEELRQNPTILQFLFQNDNAILSMKLNITNFVVLDLDPANDSKTQPPKLEKPLLEGLYDLCILQEPA